MDFANIFNRGLFGEPAFLLGMIALIGLVLQKAKFQQVLNGTIKTMLGYILLQIGGSAAGAALSNLSAMMQQAFQVIGIFPHNETVVALAQINYGQEIAFIMLIGMVLHLGIARFTRFKYIFLTGHHILFMASLLAGLLVTTPLSLWQVYVIGGIMLALSMSFGPVIAQPFVRQVVGGNQIAIGHFNSVGYAVTGLIARLFKSKRVEKPISNKFKTLQAYFQDNMIVITVFTFVLFFVSSLFISAEGMDEMFSGQHFVAVSFMQAVSFAAGVFIILQGVRMMLSEIIPAFNGIAERMIPRAVPALDCPVLFTYAPVAAIFGFLISFAGGVAAMCVLISYQYTIIIPGVVPHFFSGGAAGVIGYQVGGKRGLVAGTFVHGFIITILPALLVPLLSGLGYIRATFADSDFAVIGMIVHWIGQLFY